MRETQTIGNTNLDIVSQFDHIFWMGDLNYRLDLNATRPSDAMADKAENWAAVKLRTLNLSRNVIPRITSDVLPVLGSLPRLLHHGE